MSDKKESGRLFVHNTDGTVDRVMEFNKTHKNGVLGKTINIPIGSILEAGISKMEFGNDYYELIIGIGKDHTAILLLSEQALLELNKMQPETSIY